MRQTETCPFEVEVSEQQDAVVVTARGDAGHRQAGPLAEALAQVMALRPRRVVLDLLGLGFLSSVSAGVLVAFRHAVLRGGTHVTVKMGRRHGRFADDSGRTRG